MSRTRILSVAAAVLLSVLPVTGAEAGSYGTELQQCLIRHVSSDDRAVLSRFIFTAIAANPALKPYTKLSNADRDRFRADMTALFVRLMGTDCHQESVAALRHEGSAALLSSLPQMGKVAVGSLLDSSDMNETVRALNCPEVISVLQALIGEAEEPDAKS